MCIYFCQYLLSVAITPIQKGMVNHQEPLATKPSNIFPVPVPYRSVPFRYRSHPPLIKTRPILQCPAPR